MIDFHQVVKRYDSTLALDRLSFQVPDGAVFGLLGPNGAGKTTILRLIMGLIFPTAGEVDRDGLATSRVGYLPERACYPPRFGVRDYVLTTGRLAGLRAAALRTEVNALLAQFELHVVARRKLGACSRGMLQRVGLAQALIGDPPLLLLDEPASGLDPAGQKFVREQILALQAQGRTVLLSSHHLDEVTRVCTHIAVLSQGRLVRSGTLGDVLAPRTEVTILTAPLAPELRARLPSLAPGMVVEAERIALTGQAVAHKAKVLRLLLDHDVDIHHLSERRATLEEIYLEATGE